MAVSPESPTLIPGCVTSGAKRCTRRPWRVWSRPGFGFGISMCSSRIYNYESINGENLHGWFTGDGMTYLYNSDLNQFAGLRLPEIIVVNRAWVTGA